MCLPAAAVAAIPWITAALTVGTGVYAANQQRQAGKAAAEMSEAQARVDQVAKGDAMARGDRETERMLWRTRQALGQQRTAIAAAGVAGDYGTPLDLLGETAFFGEMEQQDARLNAAREAWGYDVSATNNRNTAAFQRWNGKAQATGTLLGSLAQAGQFTMGNTSRGGAGRASVGPVQREPIPMPRYRYT